MRGRAGAAGKGRAPVAWKAASLPRRTGRQSRSPRSPRPAPAPPRPAPRAQAIRTQAPKIGGSFAVWGGLFSSFDCTLVALRKKEDPWNSIAAGALTGGFLQLRTGLQSAAKSAVFGGVLLVREGAGGLAGGAGGGYRAGGAGGA